MGTVIFPAKLIVNVCVRKIVPTVKKKKVGNLEYEKSQSRDI